MTAGPEPVAAARPDETARGSQAVLAGGENSIGFPPRAKTVLVIDDHPVVALGIKLALRADRSLAFADALCDPMDPRGVVAALRPDAFVLDLAFAGGIDLSLVRRCRSLVPHAVVVVFSSLPARVYAQAAIEAGADAYIGKDHDIGDLLALLSSLLAKAPAAFAGAPPGAAAPEIDRRPFSSGLPLTGKQTEIARLLSRGLSIAEIAARTGANRKTVAAHRDNIRRKLGCRSSAALIARLAKAEWPDDADG